MNQLNQSAVSVLRICVAANFTVEPIQEFMEYWTTQLGIPSEIHIAAYNQVFQQLLEGGLLRSNRGGINLVALNLDAWIVDGPSAQVHIQLERVVADLMIALRSAGAEGAGGAVMLFPGPSDDRDSSNERATAIAAAMATILKGCQSIPGWDALDLGEAVTRYSITTTHDPFTEDLGDIPFTEEMYAAAATVAARWIRATCSKPRKVIVLDCDNTLWQGIYGEGTMEVTPAYRHLQEFMLRQLEGGMLLALASKNSEADVMAALESDSCLLHPEHFAAWQINWSPKSENLKSIAQELGLALNSFVFLDDSSYECMEVRNRCPEVMVVEVPTNPEQIPDFLEHLWVFDRVAATAEDQSRTSLYQAERQRTELNKRAPSIEEYLASLQIEVQFAPVSETEIARVAQLTQRTTQFNLTGIRHTEQSLLSTLGVDKHECWTVRVQDVFGDYGLVGVLLFRATEDVLRLDNFLLSCRALGRGVEDRMLERLKRCAVERGADRLIVPVVPTARNRPALDFLSQLCVIPPDPNAPFECVLSAVDSSSEWRPVMVETTEEPMQAVSTEKLPVFTDAKDTVLRIATQLRSGAAIVNALRAKKKQRPAAAGPLLLPHTAVEESLVQIWSEYLGVESVGIQDNFFDFGGGSLLATRILSRVWTEFGVKLSILELFETPTVEGLATSIANALSLQST